MNKKIFLAITMSVLLLAGCGKTQPTNTQQKSEQPPISASSDSGKALESDKNITPPSKAAAIDYSQYVKKTWIEEKGANNVSFCISKIVDGKIAGRFTSDMPAVPSYYDLENLTGTINNDTAQCEFSDTKGNKGTIQLIFKPNDRIEASIKLTDKSQSAESRPGEGTFEFIPYNLRNIKGFKPVEDQSFMVDLDSWGSVKFVSGKLTAGSHIPTVFYLTNKDGDILYDFADTPFPYSVDVKAVSFKDVNKDGLKDIIIIVADNYEGSEDLGRPIAAVIMQNAKGIFVTDTKLSQEINNSGKNKDIKTIMEYLSQKF